MSGRRSPLRSPWLAEGMTRWAAELSGCRRFDMGLGDPAFGRDALPGGVDDGQPLGRDANRLGRQAARDLAVGMVVGHELAIAPFQGLVVQRALDAEDDVRIVLAPDVAGRD